MQKIFHVIWSAAACGLIAMSGADAAKVCKKGPKMPFSGYACWADPSIQQTGTCTNASGTCSITTTCYDKDNFNYMIGSAELSDEFNRLGGRDVPVTIVGACANHAYSSTSPNPSSFGDGYCWCRMKLPVYGNWQYLRYMADSCQFGCAKACLELTRDDVGMSLLVPASCS